MGESADFINHLSEVHGVDPIDALQAMWDADDAAEPRVKHSLMIKPELRARMKAYAESNNLTVYMAYERALESFLTEVEESING